MKTILLISDSHGDSDTCHDLFAKYVGKVDMMIHCGDVCDYTDMVERDYLCVLGNNDYANYPKEKILKIEDRTILVTHGTRLTDYTDQKRLAAYAKSKDCDTVFYGHTHIPKHIITNGIELINPGSIRYNRDMSGRSYAIVKIEKNYIAVKHYYL